MKRSTSASIVLCVLLGVAATAAAGKPVVYTLYSESNSVGSVWLGTTLLTGLISFQFKSDTSNTIQTTEGGVTVWRNDSGEATFTISQGSRTTVAHIKSGQIYVRYDPTNGIVGFGSYAAGITYPMSLNCQGDPCTGYSGGVVGGLADIKVNSATNYAPDVSGLATDLRGPALLTGFVTYCPVGVPTSCTSPAAPISTDLGPLRIFSTGKNIGSGVFTALVGETEEGDN
jgi:hypothetical protein